MARKKNSTIGPVDLTGKELVPIIGSREAVAKIAGVGGTVIREGGTTLVTGRPYATRAGTIDADEIYYVDGLRRDGEGPGLGEADKVAWRDPATGFECIMLRSPVGGALSGYVGVPRDHPLWGWEASAISVDFGIEVHGNVNYSRLCDDGPASERELDLEAQRICHVPRTSPSRRTVSYASEYRVEDAHAWWFGFSCDHAYDLVPNARPHDRPDFLSAETGREYRDDAYVYGEVRNLANQLLAIANGDEAPPRDGAPLPAIGLDPREGDR
jgi:hypothetical protein